MAKKPDEAEVKKECPSCGLGVALDTTICEFCGWDFEEEDEWIIQIEKLERDLMLEKQKFEPGSMNEKIESTLHAPTLERIEALKAAAEAAPEISTRAPPQKASAPASSPARTRTVARAESSVQEQASLQTEMGPPIQKVRRVRTVKTMPAGIPGGFVSADVSKTHKVRRVRTVKSAPAAEEKIEEEEETGGLLRSLAKSEKTDVEVRTSRKPRAAKRKTK